MPRPPYGGGTFIADASAWARASHHDVVDEWIAALRNGQIATCPVVQLELLYSTRDGASFDQLADDLAQLRVVPVTRSVTDAALSALRALAHVQPLHHRIAKFPDLLVAAAAQDAGIGVLHFDAHFDTLAGVLHFESRWIAPRGSLS